MKSALFSLLLLPALLAAAPAMAQIAGPWAVSGQISGNPFVVNCQFTPSGGNFGGVCVDAATGKPHRLTAGAISGNQVRWSYPAHFMFLSFDVCFTGALTGGGMAGTVTASGHRGAFTATRK
jgi:hypothetical protein